MSLPKAVAGAVVLCSVGPRRGGWNDGESVAAQVPQPSAFMPAAAQTPGAHGASPAPFHPAPPAAPAQPPTPAAPPAPVGPPANVSILNVDTSNVRRPLQTPCPGSLPRVK